MRLQGSLIPIAFDQLLNQPLMFLPERDQLGFRMLIVVSTALRRADQAFRPVLSHGHPGPNCLGGRQVLEWSISVVQGFSVLDSLEK